MSLTILTDPLDRAEMTSCVSDDDLGACANCSKYRIQGPHQIKQDGRVWISCRGKQGLTLARTDIASFDKCEENIHKPFT